MWSCNYCHYRKHCFLDIHFFSAQRIVFQLAEHGMQLPITFGHYEVVGWSIEPKSKRYLTFGESSFSMQHHIVFVWGLQLPFQNLLAIIFQFNTFSVGFASTLSVFPLFLTPYLRRVCLILAYRQRHLDFNLIRWVMQSISTETNVSLRYCPWKKTWFFLRNNT